MKKLLSVLLLVIMAFCTACARGEVSEEYFPHQAAADRKPYSAVKILKDPNDPYSAVIEQYYRLVLDESADASDALNYYRYTLYDIDGDGTKELLLSVPQYVSEKTTAVTLKHIFSVKEGAAFEVKAGSQLWDQIGDSKVESRHVFTNGIVKLVAGRNACYFKYSQGNLTFIKEVIYLSRDENNNTDKYKCYYLDENGDRQSEEINSIDFSNSQKELLDGATWVEFVWLPLESYGRLNQARDYYYLVVKQLYDRIVKSNTTDEKAREYTLNNNFYAFYDIDGNGTEELLIAGTEFLWGSGYISTRDPDLPVERGIVFDTFYTFDGESVAEDPFFNFLWWDCYSMSEGGRDVMTNGLIRYYGGTKEHISYAYFRYSDGKLEFVEELNPSRLFKYDDQGNEVNKEITTEEFERLKSEIEDGADVVDIQWQTFKSYGDKNS